MIKFDQRHIIGLKKLEAVVTGFKANTIRLKLPDGKTTALCTLTYSCDMNLQLQQELAGRIATIWNNNR